jgi:hypothetical protein
MKQIEDIALEIDDKGDVLQAMMCSVADDPTAGPQHFTGQRDELVGLYVQMVNMIIRFTAPHVTLPQDEVPAPDDDDDGPTIQARLLEDCKCAFNRDAKRCKIAATWDEVLQSSNTIGWVYKNWLTYVTKSAKNHLPLSDVTAAGDITLSTVTGKPTSVVASMSCSVTLEGSDGSVKGSLSMASDAHARDWIGRFTANDQSLCKRKALRDSGFDDGLEPLHEIMTLRSVNQPAEYTGKGKGKSLV